MSDTRPLHVRVRALSNRFAAIASGARKRAQASLQDAENADRDAATLAEAADEIERLNKTP